MVDLEDPGAAASARHGWQCDVVAGSPHGIEKGRSKMSYFVVLWNPAQDPSSVKQLVRELERGQAVGRWSCGGATWIKEGDIAILRRSGVGPRGIIGFGRTIKGSYVEPWDRSNPDGDLGHFVRIDWEYLWTDPVIDALDPRFSGVAKLWSAQAGGAKLSDSDGEAIVDAVVKWDAEQFLSSFVPSAERFAKHWTIHPPTPSQKKMLLVHYDSPEHTIHPIDMAHAMGWRGQIAAHGSYGRLARDLAAAMGVSYPSSQQDRVSFLARWQRRDLDGQIVWRMHDEVRAAIEELGWHLESNPIAGDAAEFENAGSATFREGQWLQRTINFRDRNASVREHCLAHYGAKCRVCLVKPGSRFGGEFSEMIEVHHLDPIAENDLERETDPERDCLPLCPTCHRLAHHGMAPGTCRSIDELKAIIARRPQDPDEDQAT